MRLNPCGRSAKAGRAFLSEVRAYDRCGLCDATLPQVAAVNNLYEGKIWSQLFYDSLVPFDTASRTRIRRAGYTDPQRDFLAMNRELFGDLTNRTFAEIHSLGVLDIRQLDSPRAIDPSLTVSPRGQPLSRVVDKIFYSPSRVLFNAPGSQVI